MLSLGVETWSKSLHKVGFTRKARVLVGLQGQTPGFPASNFLLRFPKTLWAFPFGPNNVFSYPNISGNIRNPFQRSNTIIPYIKLYLRTIPEFLVMSMISSGTPNNIRLPTYITHIILYRQRNVKRADPTGSRTCFRSITNSGTWMPTLAPTYSTKIFIGQTA